MKRILLLLVFAAISLTGFSQFMYEGGKAIAYVDSFVQRGSRFYITNNGRTSDAYFRTSGDSLFFGDVNGEKYMGAIGTGGGSMIYPQAGIPLSTGSAWGTSITNNSANWNTAYGWGNHGSAGYVPQTRTITINGTSYDLSANRSWTISGGTGGVKSGDLLQSQGDTTLGAYNSGSKAAGRFYLGLTNPTNYNRLNYDGSFYSTTVYSSSYNSFGADPDILLENNQAYSFQAKPAQMRLGLYYDLNTISYFEAYPGVTNSATAVSYKLSTLNNLTTPGAKLLSVQNQNVEKFYIDYNGNAYANGVLLGSGGGGAMTFDQILDSITTVNAIASPWKVNFKKLRNTYPTAYTIGSAITLTPDTAGALDQATATIQFLGSGTGSLTFAPPFESANGIDTDTCLNEASHLYTYLLGCMGYGNYRLYTYSLQKDKLAPGAPIPPVQLSPPSSFQATAASQTQINLTWVLPSPNGRNFQIYDSIVGTSTNFTNLLASPIKSATSYSHTGLTNGQQVYYRIRTIGSGTDTLTSSYATSNATTSALTTLTTPTNFTATAESTSQINLAWTDIANESSYEVYRSPDNSNWTQIGGTIAANSTSYNATGLTASTLYYFRLRGIGDLVTYNHSSYATDSETTQATNTAPSFTSVTLSGTAKLDSTLTATANGYSDANGDAAGTHLYQWERSDNGSTGWADISGATSTTYTLVSADSLKYVRCGATPVAATGTSPGTEVFSSASAQVTGAAPEDLSTFVQFGDFTNAAQDGTSYYTTGTGSNGRALNGANPLVLPANGDGYIKFQIKSTSWGFMLISLRTINTKPTHSYDANVGIIVNTDNPQTCYIRNQIGTNGEGFFVASDNNTWARIRRSGSTFYLEYSTDNCLNWTISMTHSYSSTAQMYLFFHEYGGYTGKYLYNPKQEGFQ